MLNVLTLDNSIKEKITCPKPFSRPLYANCRLGSEPWLTKTGLSSPTGVRFAFWLACQVFPGRHKRWREDGKVPSAVGPHCRTTTAVDRHLVDNTGRSCIQPTDKSSRKILDFVELSHLPSLSIARFQMSTTEFEIGRK